MGWCILDYKRSPNYQILKKLSFIQAIFCHCFDSLYRISDDFGFIPRIQICESLWGKENVAINFAVSGIADIDKWSDRMRKPFVDVYGEEYFRKHWLLWIDAYMNFCNKNEGWFRYLSVIPEKQFLVISVSLPTKWARRILVFQEICSIVIFFFQEISTKICCPKSAVRRWSFMAIKTLWCLTSTPNIFTNTSNTRGEYLVAAWRPGNAPVSVTERYARQRRRWWSEQIARSCRCR